MGTRKINFLACIGVMLYIMETVLAPDVKNRMEILSSECATKSFWWAQWVPEYNFLAVAQTKKVLPSSFDEDSDAVEQSKPIFSALQFHEKYPRENVVSEEKCFFCRYIISGFKINGNMRELMCVLFSSIYLWRFPLMLSSTRDAS